MDDLRRYEWEIDDADDRIEYDEICYPRPADDPERLLLRVALRIANRREQEKNHEETKEQTS